MMTFREQVEDTMNVLGVDEREAVILELLAMGAWARFAMSYRLPGNWHAIELFTHVMVMHAIGAMDGATKNRVLATVLPKLGGSV